MQSMQKEIKVQSPGRINIIGEHTDYNDGFVLPAAIDKKTIFSLKRNGTAGQCTIKAVNPDEKHNFDLSGFSPLSGGWQNYVMGVVHELQQLGAMISGFDGEFWGDVPIGSGMSSSAALECSLAYGLNELFDLGLEKWQLIKACQMAEHHFVGIQCGIMDQFASVMGRKNQVMLLDCRSLDFQYFPFDLGEYRLLLLNTNVSHALASSEYNTRRAECEEGVHILKRLYPGILNLRDVSPGQVDEAREQMPDRIFRRCRHVTTENQRVRLATQAMLAAERRRLGELVYQSHFSLQNDYEVSCPELDFLVQQTLDKDYIPGARMMGGGFGGCTINIIAKNRVDEFVETTARIYRTRFGIDLTPYTVSIEDGTSVVGRDSDRIAVAANAARRFCFALDLKDDNRLIEEYKNFHAPGKVWPEITDSIKGAGILDMEIYLTGNRMFMIMEVDDRFDAARKAALDAANPKVKEWEELMWKFQQAIPWAKPGEKWLMMDRIFKLDC